MWDQESTSPGLGSRFDKKWENSSCKRIHSHTLTIFIITVMQQEHCFKNSNTVLPLA